LKLIIEADGGSRGNPGPAAYGCLVKDAQTNEVLFKEGKTLGITTNNVAEYSGLVAALAAAHEIDPNAQIEVRMDSKLVVEQMSGNWKIKHENMKVLVEKARNAFAQSQVKYVWVPREDNLAADTLLNIALDAELNQ
jgi:ribonuclease H / adenosylcobalamin/alpha-ribazole phosphatase